MDGPWGHPRVAAGTPAKPDGSPQPCTLHIAKPGPSCHGHPGSRTVGGPAPNPGVVWPSSASVGSTSRITRDGAHKARTLKQLVQRCRPPYGGDRSPDDPSLSVEPASWAVASGAAGTVPSEKLEGWGCISPLCDAGEASPPSRLHSGEGGGVRCSNAHKPSRGVRGPARPLEAREPAG